MGSLMAGWDSPLSSDPKAVMFQRNKSLTKEEVDGYWRLKKKKQEEDEKKEQCPRSSSAGSAQMKEDILLDTGTVSETSSLEKLIHTHGWWVSSNWAHLNEPPPEEGDYKYISQFHVANRAANDDSNRHHAGISHP
ncbi:unnamed protein product [Cuscuta campestris]|uniref:Uncharacterized protein n=2 Tax=Cuscuta sect. Cleistogrammica TaxID=1824901 RepID=A0A484KK81_9ASTE|nr:hypothetical protein DM860_006538 [Cuscuta australis]VFQ62406.1 unnamed protein product [Cuscuta campestris]